MSSLLVVYNARVDEPDAQGRTPLCLALMGLGQHSHASNYLELILTFLNWGASVKRVHASIVVPLPILFFHRALMCRHAAVIVMGIRKYRCLDLLHKDVVVLLAKFVYATRQHQQWDV